MVEVDNTQVDIIHYLIKSLVTGMGYIFFELLIHGFP